METARAGLGRRARRDGVLANATSPQYAVPLVVNAVTAGNAVKTGEPLSSTHLMGENEVPARETLAQINRGD